MTMRDDVIAVLRTDFGKPGATATDICKELNWEKSKHPTKLSSLSGLLYRMVKDGTLRVIEGFGPRGGNGYYLTETIADLPRCPSQEQPTEKLSNWPWVLDDDR